MAVKIVRINGSHAKKRYEALAHPEVSKWVFIDLPVSYTKTQEWCESVGNRPSRADFCFEVDGVPAGFAGLVNVDSKSAVAELYIFLHSDFFSKGLGSEFLKQLLSYGAFELNLRKVSLFVTADNTNAISYYEKNGFEIEGMLRKHVWFRGAYRDRVIMSIFLDGLSLNADKFYNEIV